MSWGEGEYHQEWWEKTPDYEYFCSNCGQQIYYPYKWRNVDKSKTLTKDWKIIKSKTYVQINEDGKWIRLCDCCDELYTTEQLIKLFLISGMGKKGRKKEKLNKWNEGEKRIRQKAVIEFGEKIMVYELCSDCGGTGFIKPNPNDYRERCENCLGGKITKLIPLYELSKSATKDK